MTGRYHTHAGCVLPHSPRMRHVDPFAHGKHLSEVRAWRLRRARGPGGALRWPEENRPCQAGSCRTQELESAATR